MISKQGIRIEITQILRKGSFGVPLPDDFMFNCSLLEEGIVDSFGLLDFVCNLKVKFKIKISDREIHPGNFETIDRISDYIYGKLNSASNENV